MSEVHRCPVCDGAGLVYQGFYSNKGLAQNNDGQIVQIFTGTGTGQETCRSCEGRGYIVVHEPQGTINFNYEEPKTTAG
jgi:DnaJ-class molecular chaperone